MARIVFAGTSDFALPGLKGLAEEHDVLHVFTQPDKPVGRGQELEPTPVKMLCEKLSLSFSQPEKLENDPFWENPPEFDYLITASYGQIIPEDILKMPQLDSFNVHASLLPKYRGASPIQNALLNGDRVTGVSIIRMVKKLDAGEIFLQQEEDVLDTDTFETLSERLAPLGAKLLLQVLEIYESIHPFPQDDLQVTRCKKISRADGEVLWSKDAQEIYNQWRAFTPWPGIFTFWNGKRLKLLKVSYVEDNHVVNPGVVYKKDDAHVVACGSNAVVLHKVQLEGKTAMGIEEFMRGNDEFAGSMLGAH